MKNKKLCQLEKRIEEIKRELQQITEMRPGSLTRQYRVPKDKVGPYYQLSYTHKMKSHTEYIRREYVAEIRKQISHYKRFKKLVQEWVALAIEHSKVQMGKGEKRDYHRRGEGSIK
jgi:hypothetical protein